MAYSPHFKYSVQEALRLGTGVLVYFVVAYQFRRSEHISKVVDLLVYIAIGVSAIAFAQFGLSSADDHYATGLFGDHQLLASFLMLLLAVRMHFGDKPAQAPNKQLVAQIASVMTNSAGPAAVSGQKRLDRHCRQHSCACRGHTVEHLEDVIRLLRRKHEIVMPAMLFAVAIGFFFLVSPEAGNIGDRIQSTVNSHDSAVEYRHQLAAGAINMIKARPVFGQGVGLYSLYQERYTDSGMKVWMLHDKLDHERFARAGLGETAHNLYLQTAAELGIPGALIFVCIPLFFIVGGLRKVATMDTGIRRSVMLAAIASTVAFAVDAAGSPSWQYGQISLFFWITLGLGVGCLRPRAKHYSSARELEDVEEPATPSLALGFMRGAGLLAAVVLAAVMVPSLVCYGSAPATLFQSLRLSNHRERRSSASRLQSISR